MIKTARDLLLIVFASAGCGPSPVGKAVVTTGIVISSALDDRYLYWSDFSEGPASQRVTIGRVDKNSGSPATLMSNLESPYLVYPDSLTVDGDWLYFLNETLSSQPSAVMRIPLAGGPASVVFDQDPFLCAVRGGALFVSDGNKIWHVDAESRAATLIFAPMATWEIQTLMTDGARVFFVVSSDYQTTFGRMGLFALSADSGSQPEMLIGGEGLIWRPIVAGDFIYSSTNAEDSGKAQIRRVPKDGSAAPSVVIEESGSDIHSLFVDGGALYWSVAAVDWRDETYVGQPGRIMRLALGGSPIGGLRKMAEQTSLTVELIGTDETSLFFVDDNSLRSMPR
jgi:hypothetical protein